MRIIELYLSFRSSKQTSLNGHQSRDYYYYDDENILSTIEIRQLTKIIRRCPWILTFRRNGRKSGKGLGLGTIFLLLIFLIFPYAVGFPLINALSLSSLGVSFTIDLAARHTASAAELKKKTDRFQDTHFALISTVVVEDQEYIYLRLHHGRKLWNNNRKACWDILFCLQLSTRK